MLEAPRSAATSALTSFVPRQVMLDSRSATAIDAKKKKKKESRSKPSSETLENDSDGPKTPTQRQQHLLALIAFFLESNGFNKTLSVLRSEVELESHMKDTSINLEDLVCNCLESRGSEEDAINKPQEKDLQKTDTSTKDELEDIHNASNHIQKKKRKHKKESDEGTDLVVEDHLDLEKLKSAENSQVEVKDKKKKKKSLSVPLEENAEKENLEICEIAKYSEHENILSNPSVNDKAKKKKKHKVSSDVRDEKTEPEDLIKIQNTTEEKIAELPSTILAESNAEHKREKKKKKIKETETTFDSLATEEALKEPESVKEKTAASGNNDSTEKKSHKKRKRLDSEEKASQVETGIVAEESKLEKDGQESGTPQLAKGKLEKNENEGGTSSKAKKRQKLSDDPKTVNAFQRVKVDEVMFADERLQDNSYWALDDTGSGYGAKAQEVLGQVRGRDFRHEKTKKKRGSYRGGQIDLQSHSVKFNHSDEE